MRPFITVTLYIAAALLLAALLVPQAVTLFESVPPDKMLRHIARLLLIVGFFFMIRLLNVNERNALGYDLRRNRFLIGIGQGWLAGMLMLAALMLLLMLFDIRFYTPDTADNLAAKMVKYLISGAISGLLIGILEETFFRGMLFTAIKRSNGLTPAVLLSSALYAAMHFLVAPPHPAGTPLQWNSGLALLPGLVDFLLDPIHLDSMLGLFFAGVILSLVREYSGNIALCIGIHAGWVTIIKLAKFFTDTNRESELIWMVGGYDEITGLLGALLFTLLLPTLLFMLKRKKSMPTE